MVAISNRTGINKNARNVCLLVLLNRMMLYKHFEFSHIPDDLEPGVVETISKCIDAAREKKTKGGYLEKFLRLSAGTRLFYSNSTLRNWIAFLECEDLMSYRDLRKSFGKEDVVLEFDTNPEELFGTYKAHEQTRILSWAHETCIAYFAEKAKAAKTVRPAQALGASSPPAIQQPVLRIDDEYWRRLRTAPTSERKKIIEQFYWYGAERHTSRVVAWEEPNNVIDAIKATTVELRNASRSLHDVITGALLDQMSAYIKVSAGGGEGKTVLLWQIALFYAEEKLLKPAVFMLDHTNFADFSELITAICSILSGTPVILLIDTPFFGSTALFDALRTIVRKRECDEGLFSFVVVAVDHPDRFKARDEKLYGIFERVYECKFKLDADAIGKVEAKLLGSMPDTVEPIVGGYAVSWALAEENLTVGDRIILLLKRLKQEHQIKTNYDWEEWDVLTSDKDGERLHGLFAFVALFTYLGYSVPLRLFDGNYIDGVDGSAIATFLAGDSSSLIKIVGLDLALRNERIAKWYFEKPEHRRAGLAMFRNFVSRFSKDLDETGCRLLRNTYGNRENLYRGLVSDVEAESVKSEIREAFETYCKKVESRKKTAVDASLHKTYTSLSQLEDRLEDQLRWLDRCLASDRRNLHARSRKIKLILDAGARHRYRTVELLIDDLYRFEPEGRYYFSQRYRLDRETGRLRAKDYVRAAEAKPLFRNALLDTIGHIDLRMFRAEALYLAGYITSKWKGDTKALGAGARAYLEIGERETLDKAIECYRLVVSRTPHDLASRRFLTKALRLRYPYAFAEVERIWNEALSQFPNSPTPYTQLLKLYRQPLYRHNRNYGPTASKKALDVIKKADEQKLLATSIHIRTEYAKWCYTYNNKFEEAIKSLEYTIQDYPKHIHSMTELGIVYYEKYKTEYGLPSDLEMAITYLKEAIAIDKATAAAHGLLGYQSQPRDVLGNIYMQENMLPEATPVLEEALMIDPDNFPTYLKLLKVYKRLDRKGKLGETVYKLIILKDASLDLLKRASTFLYHCSEHALMREVDIRIHQRRR
ncbi:MAG TPA: hypothetical protein VEY71_03395 [Chitinophagales bacterium]|nr:hypothetical protein [Chitinophagales bacterium]